VVHALIPGKTVGAQFIGAPPIYRPLARRYPPQADNVLSKIKMDYRRSPCSAQTDFIIRIIFETA
jgi:hypothetical protein